MDNLTRGQELVGLQFNPSEGKTHDEVAEVKQTFADLIDKVLPEEGAVVGWYRKKLVDMAVGALVAAQMAVVKVLTWKKD